jgi:hypothetical protein
MANRKARWPYNFPERIPHYQRRPGEPDPYGYLWRDPRADLPRPKAFWKGLFFDLGF